MHYPGTNYLGPGTHVISNILNNKQPTSYTDYVAMLHDIDYLSNGGQDHADAVAMSRADNSLQGFAMKFGLGARVFASTLKEALGLKPLKFNGRTDTYDIDTSKLQQTLKERAQNFPVPFSSQESMPWLH